VKVKTCMIAVAALVMVGLLVMPAFCGEMSGWIKGDQCMVVEKPGNEGKVVGTILKKAAVTVEDAGEGWLRVVFAPVRHPQTKEYIEGKGYYIRKADWTTVDPCKW
jgi:hypothetical protein